MPNGRSLLKFDKNNSLSFSKQNISLTLHLLMGIYSHGNKGLSHSHTGCFPFIPIPIPNFVINWESYSHHHL